MGKCQQNSKKHWEALHERYITYMAAWQHVLSEAPI
jgi:hypothetical protein